jgi:pteridine reductase
VSEKPFAGKKALITGGARRLGREIAAALAERGADIVVHDAWALDEAERACAELARYGVRAWPVQADFEMPGECESLIRRAMEAAGSLDVLVNNASIFPPSKLDDLAFDDLARTMRVNAWAPLVLSREFVRVAGTGKIVNMLDTRVTGYDWSHVGYILSKKALAVLTRMSAIAFAPGVTVNAVAPGLILPPAGKDESYLARLAEGVPLQRHGRPSDIASAVIYLLEAEYVTGQIVYVDGGRHLKEPDDGPHPD